MRVEIKNKRGGEVLFGFLEMGVVWGRGRRECSVVWFYIGVYKGSGLGFLCIMEGYYFKKLVFFILGDKIKFFYFDFY